MAAASSTSTASNPAELTALRTLSAKIGTDPWRTQAAGGNTSYKDSDTLWVKASGMWLKDALTKDIFIPLSLSNVLAAFSNGKNCEDLSWACSTDCATLRPSIETVIHAIISWPIVIHLHSVLTIAWAVQENGEQQLKTKLAGLPWAWVPYCRPGTPLAREMQSRLRPETQIIVCGNHGLFIAAQTSQEAETLLLEVEKRLRVEHRSLNVPRPKFRVTDGWTPPAYEEIFALSCDPVSCELTKRGVLYPDHVVFLGASPDLPDAPYRIVPEHGVLVSAKARRGVNEMLLCWALVLSCLSENTKLRSLNESEVAALLNWDAEKYRQNLKIP